MELIEWWFTEYGRPSRSTLALAFPAIGSPPPMSDQSSRQTLLQELDSRQDDVLRQLDELNSRVETLLKTCLAERAHLLPSDGVE